MPLNSRCHVAVSIVMLLGAWSIQAGEKTALQEHEDARSSKDASCIVLSTCFPTAQALHSTVATTGQRQMIKAGSAFPLVAINEANLNALLAALKKLPEGKAPQSNADAIIISYREGEAWKTRQYSRADLPPEVRGLFLLLGMPEDRPQR